MDELSRADRRTTLNRGLKCERHQSVISRFPWSHIHQDHCLPDMLAIACSHLVLRLSEWYLNHDLETTRGPTVDYRLRMDNPQLLDCTFVLIWNYCFDLHQINSSDRLTFVNVTPVQPARQKRQDKHDITSMSHVSEHKLYTICLHFKHHSIPLPDNPKHGLREE